MLRILSIYVIYVLPKFLPILNQSVVTTKGPKGVEAIPLGCLSHVSGCGLMEGHGLSDKHSVLQLAVAASTLSH